MIHDLSTASKGETRNLLVYRTESDYLMIRGLWDSKSGYPGLLDANARNSKWVYDPVTNTYKTKNGSTFTPHQARMAVTRISNQAASEMRESTSQLIAGVIIASVWYARMRDVMKTLYSTIWLLNIGGVLFDDNTERNLFYAFVLWQFDFLDNYANQIRTGVQPLNLRAISRSSLYAKWGNVEHQNIQLERNLTKPNMEGRRVLGPNENHCEPEGGNPGCIDLSLLGWIPIDQLVPIGETTCANHCKCHLEFRKKIV